MLLADCIAACLNAAAEVEMEKEREAAEGETDAHPDDLLCHSVVATIQESVFHSLSDYTRWAAAQGGRDSSVPESKVPNVIICPSCLSRPCSCSNPRSIPNVCRILHLCLVQVPFTAMLLKPWL